MMFRTVAAIALAFSLLGLNAPSGVADEITDLKERIRVLSERLDKLESAESDVAELSEKVEELETATEVRKDPAEIRFGGHLKLYLADRSDGKRNGNGQNNNLSAGFDFFNLYISKALTNWLALDIQTSTQVFARATPSLGLDISRVTSGSVSTKVSEATASIVLPLDIMARAGVFDPAYSEDYAEQIWWHEQYHGNPGLLRLQEWHDIGIEFYKALEFETFSLPVNLYLLNGDDSSTFQSPTYSYVDNNGGMSGLIHLAPEFLFGQLRFLASLGYGKWDEMDDYDCIRYALGLAVNHRSLNLLSEYMYGRWDGVPLTGGNLVEGERKGYYVRARFSITPRYQAVAKFSDVELFRPEATLLTDNTKAVSLGLNYYITDSSTIMPQFMHVDADRSDGSERLSYNRFTLGWRTTF